MGGAEQAELNISGDHRLHRPPGNDVDQLRIEIVSAKDPLLLGNPQRHRVTADRSIGEQEFGRRLSSTTISRR